MTKSFKSFYMLGMAAMASVLTLSCSDNDTAVDNSNEEGINGTTSYLGVKVQMVGSSSSRATVGDPEFSDGTEAESTVSNVCALFFDKDGKYLTAGQKVTLTENNKSNNDSGNNIESTPNVVITLGPTTITSANAPIKMLLFVNDKCSSSWYNNPYDKGTSVSSFANLIGANPSFSTLVSNYVTNAEPKDAGSFEMTNSVYVDGNNTLVQATEVGEWYFKESQEEATKKDNAVTAYVERTVAKAGMSITTPTDIASISELKASPFVYSNEVYFPIFTGSNIQPFTTNNGDKPSETAFAVKVIGAIPNGVNTQGYLIKNLDAKNLANNTYQYYDGTKDNQWKTWDGWKKGSYRSYWAEDMNYTTTAESSTPTDDTRTGLKFYTFKDAKDNALSSTTWSVPSKYIYENTVDQSNDHTWYKAEVQHPNVTTMLVAAQIVPLNGTFDSNQNFTLTDKTKPVKDVTNLWRYEGIYYSKIEKIIEKEEQVLTSYYSDAEHTKQIDDTWINSKLYSGGSSKLTEMKIADGSKSYNGIYYGLTTDVGIYDSNGKSTTVNSVLANYFKEHQISYFNNGYCFYQVPIEHPVGNDNDADKIYGVVRNHIYSLTLNSISNVGAPVSNPNGNETLELIPGKDQYYYIGCTMNVLAWRNVSQNVEL